MKIYIIAVGKIKERYIQNGINDFKKRLNKFCDIEIIEIKGEKITSSLSVKQQERLKDREGKIILGKIPQNSYTFGLSVKGTPMTSKGLAKSIQNLQLQGYSDFTFIIGGALGLSQNVLDTVDFELSLSHMTFTHQMIRLILLEQIYRAMKIKRGEPYHK